jgi:hypothetical protein
LTERIPRKLSVDDLNNAELAEWVQVVRVFVDGVEQTTCIRYDMDKGEVLRYVKKDDKLVVEGECLKTELVKGKVEVSLREPV